MADDVWSEIQKNSQISVTVDEVLTDIIVVSFQFQSKVFQGVLIDSTKKLLPCGIVAPPYELPPLGTATVPLEDKLFSASQRYSYFQEKAPQNIDRLPLKRNVRAPARFKNARMTVRLRPRQVLCSKCRGICNENSENVDVSMKKRKDIEPVPNPQVARPERRLRSSGEISPRPVFPDNPKAQPKKNSHSEVPVNKKRKLCASLVPKLTPLTKTELENGGNKKIKIVENLWGKDGEKQTSDDFLSEDICSQNKCAKSELIEVDPLSITELDSHEEKLLIKQKFQVGSCDVDDNEDERGVLQEEQDPLDIGSVDPPRALRKKRSVGSMEDLWDETIFEDANKVADKKLVPIKAKTPVIKISFGSGNGEGTVLKIPAKLQSIPSESEAEDKVSDKTTRDASAKAARRALKKAKKEARRKMASSGGSASPAKSLGAASPRYPNLSPRYLASPRQNIGNSSPAYEIHHKKHKHKVKHKKRHKDEKKHKEPESDGENEVKDDSIKECLKHKLSISLKRLNSNAYMRCESSSPSNSDASDEQSDAVPDFPGNPLLMRISTQPVTSCQTSDGRQMAVGDVVWGKIHGFPWWPGKVLSITLSRMEDGACSSPQAHVAWYGSSTSSLISCDQLNPFLETFQMRYNKKKRGPYKEAIKQATTEAKKVDVKSPQVYSPPTEVDVAS